MTAGTWYLAFFRVKLGKCGRSEERGVAPYTSAKPLPVQAGSVTASPSHNHWLRDNHHFCVLFIFHEELQPHQFEECD